MQSWLESSTTRVATAESSRILSALPLGFLASQSPCKGFCWSSLVTLPDYNDRVLIARKLFAAATTEIGTYTKIILL